MIKTTPIFAAGAAAIAALGLAVPAQATDNHGHRGQQNYNNMRATLPPIHQSQLNQDLMRLNRQIDRAAANNRITWREARDLNRQLERTRAIYRNYARGGLSYREKMIIEHQIDNLNSQLRTAKLTRRGGDQRGYNGQGNQRRGYANYNGNDRR